MVKIKLLKDQSIRGKVEKAGTTVEVSEGVADWLIERKCAEFLISPKSK